MATAMTYASLKLDIARYLERGLTEASDPTVHNEIPTFIGFCERRLARQLKIQGTTEVVSSTMAAGTSVYAKPDRWRDTISFNFGTGATFASRTPLFGRSYEYCRNLWPDETQRAQPRFYADYNYQNWLITPTPDRAYPFEVLYYALPPLLGDDLQTNWLTEYAPQALLYGSLLEATPFLKNDERIATWKAYYDEAVGLLAAEDAQKIIDRNAQRREA